MVAVPVSTNDLPVVVLAALGYRHIQRLAPAFSEPGIDFVARDSQRRVVLVQWLPLMADAQVGVTAIGQLIAAVTSQHAAMGVAVTSGTFTLAATNLALHSRMSIAMYDGDMVAALLGSRRAAA